ncbi:hypothetical protein MHYP_G00219150 [Metynnis hypsauchen]
MSSKLHQRKPRLVPDQLLSRLVSNRGLVKCDNPPNKCQESERPHHVRVVYESGGEPKKCAGTLIHKQWVITAKDCYGGLEGTLKVQLGEPKTGPKNTLVIKSSDILTPLYEPILLLKLPNSVKDITPAVLPSGDCMAPHVEEELKVSGYNFLDSGTNLMCLDVKVSACKDVTDFTKSKRIFCGDNTVCKEPTMCKDDYGSGLLKKETIKNKIPFTKEKQSDTLYGVLIESQAEQFIFLDICYGPIKKWLHDVVK